MPPQPASSSRSCQVYETRDMFSLLLPHLLFLLGHLIVPLMGTHKSLAVSHTIQPNIFFNPSRARSSCYSSSQRFFCFGSFAVQFFATPRSCQLLRVPRAFLIFGFHQRSRIPLVIANKKTKTETSI